MISILLPVFNAAPFLAECLDSILRQTETAWRLYAVNDFSTDGSGDILAAYAQKDPRIRVFKNQEKGIIPALRLAFSHADGAYITRMDADDVMRDHKLASLKSVLQEKRGVATGFVEYFRFDPDSGDRTPVREGYAQYERWLNGLTDRADNWSEIYKECPIPSPCWMVRRADLVACGAFNPDRYPEDYDLAFRFYQDGLSVLPVRDVLHEWRDHPQRTSRIDPRYADNRFLDLKLYWFVKQDRDYSVPLYLWGAGQKGKWISRSLREQNVAFRWLTDNPKKTRQIIQEVMIEGSEVLQESGRFQVIVCVAAPVEQAKIRSRLNALEAQSFFFC